MAGVQIGLIALFLIFYILSQTSWVKILKSKGFAIQIHLPLLALYLSSEEKRSTTNSKSSLKASAYFRIIDKLSSSIKRADATINRITLPCHINDFDGLTLVRPFGLQAALYAAIAYLRAKIGSLTVKDNAIISSPDVKEIHFDLTLKLPLYQLIYALMTVRRSVKEEKERMDTKNVGE